MRISVYKKSIYNTFIINILLLFVLIITNCTNSNYSNQKKIFRYNESKGITSLDPAFARNQATIWPINQIYNGLLQYDDSLNLKPCIAKTWEVTKDGRELTFHLRKDVYFHNHKLFKKGIGRKVVASDFVYSFNRIIDPAIASPGLWVFNTVNKDIADKGFEAVDDSTLKIYLKSSFPAFVGLLTMPYCFVVPHEIVTFYKKEFRNNPVGSGPFIFKVWKEGEKLVLIKNSSYFEVDNKGNRLPYIDAVSITFIADKQSELLEFIKGRIDFISGVNASFKDELITKEGKLNPKYNSKFKMLTSPYLNTEYLGFMVDSVKLKEQNSLLKNKNIRTAINLSINRSKLVRYLRNNLGYPADAGFIPKGLPNYDNSKIKGYSYNPDSAKKLLQKAGYRDGKNPLHLKISTVSDYLDICEFVQHELERVGIDLEIDVVTGLAYREMLANNQMMMFRASWVADYADPENYFALFYSPNFCPAGPNYTHFTSHLFDKYYESSLNEQIDQRRDTLYYKMDQLIVDESVVIPLFYDVAVRFVNFRVKKIGINPINLLSLKNVEIKD